MGYWNISALILFFASIAFALPHGQQLVQVETISPYRQLDRTIQQLPHRIYPRPRISYLRPECQTDTNAITMGDTSGLDSLDLPCHESSKYTYTKPNATIHDLAQQLQRWQRLDNTRPQTALLTIGTADVRLPALRSTCAPSELHTSCEEALYIAHAHIADVTAGSASLRSRLASSVFSVVAQGRAASGSAFRLYVAGHDSAEWATGIADVRAAGIRGVVGALNRALFESVQEVNRDFGTEVASFVPRLGDLGGRGLPSGVWTHATL